MGDIELQAFSDRLKILRSNLGITQKDFAKKIGITASALSSYENNLKNPSISVAKKIAEAFNVSIDWLCGLSEKIKNDDTPKTYADIIDLLVKIEESMGLIHVGTKQIAVADTVLQSFLKDWEKTLPLYHDGTIDKELYKLWVDNKKKEYKDVHMGNEDEIETFLTIMGVIGSPILSMPKPSEPPQE